MKNRIGIIILLILTLLMPLTAAANAFTSDVENAMNFLIRGGYIPKAANAAVNDLDKQLLILLGEVHPRSALRIAFTVPANLNDLQKTNTLARQMSEELARGFKTKGYRIVEIRKGTEIVMTPGVGELFLTRDTAKLSKEDVQTELLLVGTYTISKRGVRFNIRLLHMNSTEVIAMATSTVPVYREIVPLLVENGTEVPPLAPTTGTKLP